MKFNNHIRLYHDSCFSIPKFKTSLIMAFKILHIRLLFITLNFIKLELSNTDFLIVRTHLFLVSNVSETLAPSSPDYSPDTPVCLSFCLTVFL